MLRTSTSRRARLAPTRTSGEADGAVIECTCHRSTPLQRLGTGGRERHQAEEQNDKRLHSGYRNGVESLRLGEVALGMWCFGPASTY